MVVGISSVIRVILVEEASEEIIGYRRRQQAVVCDDVRLVKSFQVMNIKIEDIYLNMDDKAVVKMKFLLNYRYRKQLNIVVLGCRMKVTTTLRSPGAESMRRLLQSRLNTICKSNYVISINQFFCNIHELLNTCTWVSRVETCVLYVVYIMLHDICLCILY
ncbi:U1 protein [Cow vetch latent virus]|uniref:U1 protein n=1 Tax=Cow vetch latent virus TaxID=2056780 RepID=A0A2H4T2E6_9VIRU|nr:U1 protein [Cow vetch latent virus]ATY70084.1 U1 protein [Cow vetch latent virus]